MTPLLTDLLTESRQLGFLGPGPVEPHIEHAAAYAAAVDEAPARALDLGAGGGLPGLVLAATTWPDTHWCFLDGNARRTAFLEEAVEDLDLADRVTVVCARAEVAGRGPEHRGSYDLVVARSFGAPAVTAECSAPLLRVGGLLVVSDPPGAVISKRWPSAGLAKVGFAAPEQVAAPDGVAIHLTRFRLASEAGERYPRRDGMPAKRPLF